MLKGTMDSIRRSDLTACFPWRHPEGLTDSEVQTWWEDRLLDAAKMGDFFLRLEDDVLVHPKIQHHVDLWEAKHRPDFGVGTLYWWNQGNPEGLREDSGEKYLVAPTGLLGPGILFRSEVVPDLVGRIRYRREHGMFYTVAGRFNFDTIVYEAVQDLGLRVYLRSPSLVDCRNLPSENMPGTTPDYRAKDFEETAQ